MYILYKKHYRIITGVDIVRPNTEALKHILLNCQHILLDRDLPVKHFHVRQVSLVSSSLNVLNNLFFLTAAN